MLFAGTLSGPDSNWFLSPLEISRLQPCCQRHWQRRKICRIQWDPNWGCFRFPITKVRLAIQSLNFPVPAVWTNINGLHNVLVLLSTPVLKSSTLPSRQTKKNQGITNLVAPTISSISKLGYGSVWHHVSYFSSLRIPVLTHAALKEAIARTCSICAPSRSLEVWSLKTRSGSLESSLVCRRSLADLNLPGVNVEGSHRCFVFQPSTIYLVLTRAVIHFEFKTIASLCFVLLNFSIQKNSLLFQNLETLETECPSPRKSIVIESFTMKLAKSFLKTGVSWVFQSCAILVSRTLRTQYSPSCFNGFQSFLVLS